MDTSSEAVQIDVLSAFYAKFDPAKVRTATLMRAMVQCAAPPAATSQVATAGCREEQATHSSDLLTRRL